jgi:hypothetical protein
MNCAQARHQDGAREGRRDGQAQLALAGRGALPGRGKALQRGQAFAHMGQVFAALGGQREIGAAEQLGADDLLELLDAVADGAGRDAQSSAACVTLRRRASASKVSRHWIGGMRAGVAMAAT